MADDDDLDQFSDQEIVARTLYGEARGEGYVGRQAVANVIMNRAAKPGWWGKNARSCCLKRYQFSCWLAQDPNRHIIADPKLSNSIFDECLSIAGLALADQLDDITHGATHYRVIGTAAQWAEGKTPCAVIGHHEFFHITSS